MRGEERLAVRLRAVAKPEVLRFGVCTVRTRDGYTWGAATSSSEEIVRLLCDMWNNRHKIADALEQPDIKEP